MIAKSFYLFLFVFIYYNNEILGQDNLSMQDDYYNATIMSPQSYAFTQYGNHTPELARGEVSLKIPLYTYKDRNFEIPIELRYNSPGFRPNKREGIVGLGWNLGAGGAITRVINGVADETHHASTLEDIGLSGMYYGIKSNLGVKETNKKEIFELTKGNTGKTAFFWSINGCEVDPDMFFINVPGLSGKFYIQNNGEVKVVGNKPFKVDLSGFSIQGSTREINETINPSTFTIVTDDGYEYLFGGSLNELDFTLFIQEGAERSPVINAWHLTKIISPTGQVIEYFYKDFKRGFFRGGEGPNDRVHLLYNENYVRVKENINVKLFPKHIKNISNSNLYNTLSATKATYLDSISVNESISIRFEYVENERKFYPEVYMDDNRYNQFNLRLDGIEVVNSNYETIKKFKLNQEYLGEENKRRFLKSVQEIDPLGQDNINPYTFSYHDTKLFPSPTKAGVDHWGFWNSTDFNYGAVIPDLSLQPNGDVLIVGDQREASADLYKVGMLKEIIYPTLGHTRFFYERHQYSKRLERRAAFRFKHYLFNESGIAGGARISRIESMNQNQIVTVKQYNYSFEFPDEIGSSGVLMEWPRYLFYVKNKVPIELDATFFKVKSNSFSNGLLGAGNYIEYAEVNVVMNGSGFTKYKFTNYLTNPDESYYYYEVLDFTDKEMIVNFDLFNSYVGIKFNDKHFERGYLYYKRNFKQIGPEMFIPINGFEVKEFTSAIDYPDDYVVGVHHTGGIVQSFKRYHYPFLPKKVEEVQYNSNGYVDFVVAKAYEYNKEGYLAKESIIQSGGEKKSKVTLYPNDYANGTEFLDAMKDKNILSYPVEMVEYIENETEGISSAVISGNINKYNITGNGLVDESFILEIEAPLSFTNFKFSNQKLGISPELGTNQIYQEDSHYASIIKFDRYDNYGNIIQLSPKTSPTTSLLWGYSGMYPIAEVIGARSWEMAFTSFEVLNEGGGWIYDHDQVVEDPSSPSGKNIFPLTLNFNLQKDKLIADKSYVISYWRKSNGASSVSVSGEYNSVTGETVNGWTYEEKWIRGKTAIDLTGEIPIDEVRLYPVGTSMTTRIYNPLIGMTFLNNGRGYGANYQYDGLGRLGHIQDEEGILLESYKYIFSSEK